MEGKPDGFMLLTINPQMLAFLYCCSCSKNWFNFAFMFNIMSIFFYTEIKFNMNLFIITLGFHYVHYYYSLSC